MGSSRLAFLSLALAGAALTAIAATPPSPAPASAGAIVFARPDLVKGAWYRLPEGVSAKAVVLRAFGRVWTDPAPVKDGRAEIPLPALRVPTVFSVTAEDNQAELGQIVAYPPAAQAPRKGRLHVAGASPWFVQWAEAVSFEASVLAAPKLDAGLPKGGDGKVVLVLGSGAAGRSMAGFLRLARRQGTGIVVLQADWFGPEHRPGKPVSVGPAQMRSGLARVHSQDWPEPLAFASRRLPWPGLCNRLAWIAGKDGPLVEEVFLPGARRRVVVSYVPWWEQLGRRDVADETLLGILAAAAEPMDKVPTFKGGIELLHPPTGEVKPDQRPVLAAALALQARAFPLAAEGRACVLDLRGPKRPPGDLLPALRKRQDDSTAQSPLLVLGDDPVLGQWDWLRLDREKLLAKTPHVVWLAEDELPPSQAAQSELMQAMTQLGIPLWDDKQEKDHETERQDK